MLTKTTTATLPPTGSREVNLVTENGVQTVIYKAIDSLGEGHLVRFTVADVLAAHPEIDGATFAATLAIFRAYGDAACGFTDQ